MFSLFSKGLSGLEGYVAFWEGLFHTIRLVAVLSIAGLILGLVSLIRKWTWIAFTGSLVNLLFMVPTCGYLFIIYSQQAADPYRIHVAVQSGDIHMVQRLLNKGFDINYSDKGDFTPLKRAETNHDVNMVKFLIAKGARIDDVSFAVCSGDRELAQLLFDHGAKPGGLNIAIEKADTQMVEFLLQHGADANEVVLNTNRRTVLHHAVVNANADIVNLLVSHGANASAKDDYGDTPLHMLSQSIPQNSWKAEHRRKVANILLEAGADIEAISERGRTPLGDAADLAASTGETDAVQILIEHGADINNVKEPQLRLIAASFAMTGDEFESWFQTNIKDANIKNENGVPVLSLATMGACRRGVDILLRHEANVDARDRQGNTALHLVMNLQNPRVEIIELLVKNGADVNARNNEGKTPLHMLVMPTIGSEATFDGSAEMRAVKLLLANGARVAIQDVHGKTPSDRYKSWLPSTQRGVKHQTEIIRLMEQSSEKPANPKESAIDVGTKKELV